MKSNTLKALYEGGVWHHRVKYHLSWGRKNKAACPQKIFLIKQSTDVSMSVAKGKPEGFFENKQKL